MNTKTITSAWAAVPDRPALMEECRQRVSALGCIEDIVDWLRDIECPFTQEAMLRVFRDYWHELEARLDDIAVWRSYNCCCLRYPAMDDTVASLIRLARERQDEQTLSTSKGEEAEAAESPIASVTDSHNVNCHNTDSHNVTYNAPVTINNAPITNNYYYGTCAPAPAPAPEAAPAQEATAEEAEEITTLTAPDFFCYIAKNLSADEKAGVEQLLRRSAIADAHKLNVCITDLESKGRLETRFLNAKVLFDALDEHFNLRFTYRTFRKYRNSF